MRATWSRWLLIAAMLIGQVSPILPVARSQEAEDAEEVSPAERIARMKRTIEREQKHLRMYQAELSDPLGEFQEVEDRFKDLDARWIERQDEIERLRETGQAAACAQPTTPAKKCREAADFDTPAPAGAGTSPSGSRTARRNFRVDTLISIRFIAHLPSQSSATARPQLGSASSWPSRSRTRGRSTATLPA